MLYDHDEEPGDTLHTWDRQARQLASINAYYQLPERLGVSAAIGGRVRCADLEGEIVDTADQYLRVLLDGDTTPVTRHATRNIAYWSSAGWVQATPLPDPYATAGIRGASR
ncbi:MULTISPECIES: hypothetical protein [Streptomyces]|uniref:hypothetical protein n=1 Tax=Streptomyces scabiei TaxID=1930 RepID=UPI001B32DFC7|nr:hypothetical protein [Streptomyces sp. LBUM 1487]MBP5888807.1 hypothetical protein [Streptomyces sp. LBUM 1487]